MHDTMKTSKWSTLLLSVLTALLLAGSGATLAATFDLWAKSGSTALPNGATVPVWGYTLNDADTLATPGGPTLIVNQGESVTVTLHNGLTEFTGVLFQGQGMVPDTTGAATGATTTYTFTATSPGTFLYEAALLTNAQHQAAMGLYGALIVRPATTGQAYADPATAFNDEAVLVLSELDPTLAANPAAFDMRNYAPKYFLINGKAYPATDPIVSAAGNKVLLRYVNAGIQHHSMAVLGLRQNFVAKDASLLPTLTHNVAAETLAPGQTADAIATIPAATTNGSKFAVYDGSLMLHNNGAAGFGGMLTFINSSGADSVPGPVVNALALTGSPQTALAATITASTNQGVSNWEYWVDSGSHTTVAVAVQPTVSVNATIPVQPTGNHNVYVRGQDNMGTWGATKSLAFVVDTTGPLTGGLTLTPNPSNGSVSVALSGTGNDTTTGNSNVVAAEYTIDGGAAVPMTLGGAAAPVRSITATIPAGLLPRSYPITVRSQDALGNWGALTTIALNVVAGGPVTSGVSAARNPNNGALPLNSSTPAVRITATMTSTGSTVAGAEGFFDSPPASINVRGFPFVPIDGAWGGTTEVGTSDIPLATINALSVGNHNIYVRGKDAAGNWGTAVMSAVPLLIDKAAPTFTGVTLSTTTAVVGATVTLTAIGAADTGGAGLSGGQYWIDGTATPPANPTAFAGTSTTFSVPTVGDHTLYVRVGDAAGNWSTVRSATLTVVPSAVNDALTLTANNNATQTSNQGVAVGVLANDLPLGAAGRTATLVSGPLRTSGTGTGTVSVTCGAAPATGVCTNGSYRVTLGGTGANGAARAASKRGTYQFTYTESLNGKTSPPATVTITVN
jgi:hypothetical protein